MLNSLTIPVLILLLGFPGLGFLSGLRLKHAREAAPADTLPPAWKPPSRLALENQFVRASLPLLGQFPVGLKVQSDPRRLRVSLDPDSGALSVVPEMGEVTLGASARRPLSTYTQDLTRDNFQRMWTDRSRQDINSLGGSSGAAPRTGLSLQLPSPLPRRVQNLLGPGGPALNVSGSENIHLSGKSQWSNQQQNVPLGQKRSLFPSLDMQQDLDIRLEGQLSDRVRVNLLQNSGVQIPLANRIAINYKGDEDDLVQQLDLGNTNLSLPGTQYVSYSGKNEGLFGVKAATRLGPLDLSILASKQEGRSERASYAGGASRQTQSIRDVEYVKGLFFFLYDPSGPAYDIPDSSIRIYFDDANSYNDVSTLRGRAFVDPLGPESANPDTAVRDSFSVLGTFSLLNPGPDQDYEILRDIYGPTYKVIRLMRPMNAQSQQCLAVTHVRGPVGSAEPYVAVGGRDTTERDGQPTRIMKLLWAPPSRMKSGTGDYFDPALPLTATRDLELRNFYLLGGTRIDPATLKIAIRKGREEPPVTNLTTANGLTIPYLEALGLDNFDETSNTPSRGHDAKVDGTLLSSTTRPFVDYENGILFFYDLRPFAPRLDEGRFFEDTLSARLYRRATILQDAAGNGSNAAIYDKYVVRRDLDAVYSIEVEFTAASVGGEITLGRSNIVDGSDVVTINGVPLVRGTDYLIDPDLGRITLKRVLRPTDQLNVDYSYAPLFAQAGRTLIGSAFRLEGRDRSLGGAFMYESKGAQDLRPRLGEEPSRSLIGDLNTAWTFRPDWVTRMVDGLPGVRTATASEFHVEAEVGASFPNPNTRNEVFIDDMEGVRDAVSLSTGPDRWRWSSVPSRATSVFEGSAVSPRTLLELQADGERIHKAEIHWYSPYSVVKERDLKPTLTDAQGAQNSRQVLALSIPRRPFTADNDPATLDTLWAGLTYPLDQTGLDLSRSQFIELWVNDFNDATRIRDRHARLHVDLGVVSENQMRAPDVPPNGQLDTEDQPPRDGQLQVSGGKNEDTGVDGRDDATERENIPLHGSPPIYRDLATSNASDPEGDNFREPDGAYKEIDPRRYLFTNGTEGNKVILPYPDTEDLDLDGKLGTDERYLEYTLDLGDTNYVATDLQRDFPGLVTADNGWRRYRIPIGDSRRVQFGRADLTLARHVRIWIEGITEPDPTGSDGVQRPLLMLGGLDIVGSRWQIANLDSSAAAAGTSVTLNSVNTVDNAEIYFPPFDPGDTRSGSQGLKRREQSISLEFTRLEPDSSLEVFKTFSLDENYSRYGKLSWFVTGFDVEDDAGGRDGAGLQYFVRLASDERGANYYEFRAPLPVASSPRALAWQEVRLGLTELSSLKLGDDFPAGSGAIYYQRARTDGSPETLIVKGRPSFTRLRRVSFGLVSSSGARTFRRGQMWFDELRAIEVAKDRGRAQRVLANGSLANLLRYNLSWNGRDADFLSVGEARGSGNSASDLSVGTTLDLHRFFEETGIVLPVSFNFYQRSSQPRFTAGDDVVRSGAQSAASETFSDGRSWQTSYQRSWSERSNPLLRYTIGGITASLGGSNGHGHNPNSLDRNRQLQAQVNYQVSPRSLLALRLPATRVKFHPLPERFFWNYNRQDSEGLTVDRLSGGDSLLARAKVIGRAATVRFGADSRPFEIFQHSFSAERNLRLANPLLERIGIVNLGRVVRWNQSMNMRYGPNFGTWIKPTFTWRSNYNQENGPELSPDLALRSIRNGQSVNVTWGLPFDVLVSRAPSRLSGGADRTAPAAGKDSGTVAAPRVPVWRDVLSRLGSLSTETAFNWSSAYSRLTGTPGLAYLTGFSSSPEPGGTGVQTGFGNTSDRSYDWRTRGQTRLALVLGASVTTSAEFARQFSNRNDVEQRKANSRFPDFQVDYGRVASAIGLDRVLRTPRLRTAFSRSRTSDFSGSRQTGESISSQWQPMLSAEGSLKSGAKLETKVERRVTRRRDLRLSGSTQTDRTTNLSFGLTRSYSQGQRVSFLGRETTVKSTVSLALSTTYSRQTGETIRDDDPLKRPISPRRIDDLSVLGTGSYGFSNNVTGNLSLGFNQNRDLDRDIVTRSVRVELAARFSF